MASLSSPPLHFNQGLRYKMLLFRAFQLWNLKHPHALSQILLHKKQKTKKSKEKEENNKKQNAKIHTEKRGVLSLFFFITLKKQHHKKVEGREKIYK